MIMDALMAYDYAKDKWRVQHTAFESVTVRSADTVKRLLTEEGRYLWPEVISIQVKSFEYSNGSYTVELADDANLPEVETLEQSIARCKKILESY